MRLRGTTTSSASLFAASLAQRARQLAARRPQPLALAAVARDQHVDRADLGQRVAAWLDLRFERAVVAVDLDQQQRARRGRRTATGLGAHERERALVEQLHAARHEAAREHRADGAAGGRQIRQSASNVASPRGLGISFSVISVITASVPSLPTSSAVTS